MSPTQREGAARAEPARPGPSLPDQIGPEDLRPKHLRVAPKVSPGVLRQRRRARFAVAGVAVISAASMFLLVTFHVFAAQAAFKLDKLESERATAQRENELLREKVASRSSATEIFNAAAVFHMVRAPKVIQLTVRPAGGGGASGAAKPSPSPIVMPPTPYNAELAGP